jgi:hypothetical protein
MGSKYGWKIDSVRDKGRGYPLSLGPRQVLVGRPREVETRESAPLPKGIAGASAQPGGVAGTTSLLRPWPRPTRSIRHSICPACRRSNRPARILTSALALPGSDVSAAHVDKLASSFNFGPGEVWRSFSFPAETRNQGPGRSYIDMTASSKG